MSQTLMLRIACLAGVVAFGIFIFLCLSIGVVSLFQPPTTIVVNPPLDLITLFAFILYLNGFAVLGTKFKNSSIVLASYALIVLNIVAVIAFYALALSDTADPDSIANLYLVLGLCITLAMLVVGWNILNLKSKLGTIAVWYGSLELLAALGIAEFFPISAVILDSALYILGIALLARLAFAKK